MADNELSRSEIEELRRVFQDTALNSFPNPDRVGCPTNQILQALAEATIPITHSAWKHAARCSPCFRKVQEFKDKQGRSRRRRRDLTYRGALMAFVVAAFSLLAWRNQRLSADLDASRKQSASNRPQASIQPPLQKQATSEREPAFSSPKITRSDVSGNIISFILWPGNQRSSEPDRENLVLPNKEARLLLIFQFDYGAYVQYKAIARSVDDDRKIVEIAGLTEHRLKKVGRTVSVVLDSKAFPDGTYIVELNGIGLNGSTRTVEQYKFTVVHRE